MGLTGEVASDPRVSFGLAAGCIIPIAPLW